MIRSIAVSAFVIGACAALAAQAPVNAPRSYDASREVSFGGVVTEVVATNGAGGVVGVHLVLETARGTMVKVHLGPAMFIGMNDGSFVTDDQILVTGAFVTHDGEMALWARQVTKNGRTITLRSPDGAPRWPAATADDPDGCGVAHAIVR
jgi:hypothetical protein